MTYVCVCVKNNQKDLENATEQLSEYLERDITSDMLCEIKQKVQDKSRWHLYTHDDDDDDAAGFVLRNTTARSFTVWIFAVSLVLFIWK